MSSYLCLSVTFLDRAFHGRKDGGVPEWPPSPLRLYQAIVAAGAARWGADEFRSRLAPALGWLESQSPPTVVAPATQEGAPYRLSVPNNAMDIVARALVRGNTSGEGDANPATHRAMKAVRSTRLIDGDTVHFLWGLPETASDDVLGHVEMLRVAASNLVSLGWGIDLVAGRGRVIPQAEADALSGERWLARSDSKENMLRVPREGTLAGLAKRHEAFLNRLPPGGGFNPVPSLASFGTSGYRRDTDPEARSYAAFALLKTDASNFRMFNTVRDLRRVVGMTRDATRRAAKQAGWDDVRIGSFVLGHGEALSDAKHIPVGERRFSFLPLPSVEGRGKGAARVVGGVRRVMLMAFAENCNDELRWAERALSGTELIDEKTGEATAILSLISASDRVLCCYVPSAVSWASVTPVVLPGFDDKSKSKTETMLRKAIRQAGFSDALAEHVELDWRNVGFWKGSELATRYRVPDYLQNYPRYHVRLSWRDVRGSAVSVPGPICLGGGRFCGFGLFAAQPE